MDRSSVMLNYLKEKGPCLPVDAAKFSGEDVLVASAILSGLLSQGNVRMSSKRIGNSSLYYVKGQEEQVREMLYSKLSEREKQLVEKIKAAGFLKNSDLTPPERFFAKELKDFIEETNSEGEVYWKSPEYNGEIKTEQKPDIPDKINDNEVKQDAQQVQVSQAQVLQKKSETIKADIREQQKLYASPIKLDKADDEFTSRVKDFFIKRKIRILEKTVVRAGSETNFVIEVQSDLMPQKYFVKARKKNAVNEKDIVMAWLEAEKSRMPIIYISNGSLSKKGKQYIDERFGDSLKFVKVSL